MWRLAATMHFQNEARSGNGQMRQSLPHYRTATWLRTVYTEPEARLLAASS
jgi:hypothetical protein